MPTYPEIPRELFRRCSTPQWNLAALIISAGPSPSGAAAVESAAGGGLWLAKFPDLNLRGASDALAFRGFRMAANGGATPIIVPRYDVMAPRPADLSAIVATTVGATSEGATQTVINIANGAALRGGETFSIQHATQNWRLYEIFAIEINADGDSLVTFAPDLREAVADNTDIEFDEPRCLMRLLNPNAMNFTLAAFPYSPQSAEFVEHAL